MTKMCKCAIDLSLLPSLSAIHETVASFEGKNPRSKPNRLNGTTISIVPTILPPPAPIQSTPTPPPPSPTTTDSISFSAAASTTDYLVLIEGTNPRSKSNCLRGTTISIVPTIPPPPKTPDTAQMNRKDERGFRVSAGV
ncbi:hypothetical protein L1987_70223 [Smallanthus sonchifolius]|uniref:Uncharacterized protein n=1 Tax=Smallanthus sonchifolius TaxID=185202 RepID=A0ACB9APR0_9ASTR|nr:hypothetical protein L1987_70223 [Smallanthus sonchifolius]